MIIIRMGIAVILRKLKDQTGNTIGDQSNFSKIFHFCEWPLVFLI